MGIQWEMKWTKKFLPPNTLLKEKYRISAVLGMGSFGITYLGMDTLLKQTVAVKEFFPSKIAMRDRNGKNVTVFPEHLEEFEDEKAIFRKEAENIFGLFDIPGICAVKDYFEENDTAYIVQEYMAGGTLKEYLDDQDGHSISWEECREMFEPVMEGLCHIHTRGIVHRDISPDNLMFTENGELKLIDFGAATVKEAVDDVKLKEDYAPPEQYKATDLTGPWSDIFALCAVMYQALTGHKPIPSMQRIRKDSLSKISNYADIPQQAEDAILQGLSLDIPKRYFYIGNLMDKLGMDSSKEKLLIGKSRAVWGEIWLKIITEHNTELQKSKKKRFSYKQKKALFISAGTIAAVIVLMFGGIKIYTNTHKEEVLKYNVQKIREENEQLAKTPTVITDTENPDEYKNMIETLAPYEIEAEESVEGVHSYDVPQEVLKSMGLRSNGYFNYGKFSVNIDSLEEILTYYYNMKPDVTSEYYYGNVMIRKTGNKSELTSSAYCTIYYSVKNEEGKEITITVEYDPVDNLITHMTLKGDIGDGMFFLKNIFSYFVQETYFTEEELDTLFAPSYEAFAKQDTLNDEEDEEITESIHVSNHALFNLTAMTSVRADYKYITLFLEPSGYYW